MGKLTLTARVVLEEDSFLAAIEGLDISGMGTTEREAQDRLVDAFMSWVQDCDGRGALEKALLEAGFKGVSEDTELELKFEESPEEP